MDPVSQGGIEMEQRSIGILHPGEMGISLAASAIQSGARVFWLPAGRSQATRARAERFALTPLPSLAALTAECELIFSVCPPAAAEEVAAEVAALRYAGLFIDANAIAPQTVQRIGKRIVDGGGRFVDGGIIGGPAWKPGTTTLYLSGEFADEAAACFAAGPLETKGIGELIGKASALKMCYAGYTKGTSALLTLILAAAEALEVRPDLEAEWGDQFAEETKQRVQRTTAKAWRFAGEMEEIAAAMAAIGLPSGFHQAAAEIYLRSAHFKESPDIPEIERVLAALLEQR